IRRVLPSIFREHILRPLGECYPSGNGVPKLLRAKSVFQSLASSADEAYAQALSISPFPLRNSLYERDYSKQLGDYRAEEQLIRRMREASAKGRAKTALDRAQYADLTFSLPGGILTKID